MDKKANANDEDYYVNSVLEEEILKNGQLKTEEWVDMYQIYASKLLKCPFDKLTKRSKLCIAMVIVGAKVLTKYPTAFRLLCYWQSIGGCYWIVQEEVLRHAAIEIVRQGFKPSGDFDSATVKMKLSKVLPTAVPSFVTHVKLREKLTLLPIKILTLVTQLDKIENPNAALEAYCKKHPLDDYIKWFLKWAYSLLREPLNIKSVTKCQYSIQYTSGLLLKISGKVPPLREGAKENKYCNKLLVNNSNAGTTQADYDVVKSIRLPNASPSSQPVTSNGFLTPEKKKRPASSSMVIDKQDAVQTQTTWTINAAVTGDKADCETLHATGKNITLAALSTVPQLSKQQKMQQLFLDTRSSSDSALKDVARGRNVSTAEDCVRNTDEEDESISSLSYESIHGSSAASSTGDEEIPSGNIQKENPPNINTIININTNKGSLHSPSFIPYSANAVAEREEHRKRGNLFDVAGDEEMAGDGRPSWRDAKRRRFDRPIASMTLSERIGHLIWEMFSPQSGAGADSDCECDSDREYVS